MTLQEKIGQRLVGGFPGREMTAEFIRLVKQYKIGNVILFKHNVENRQQLKKLCEDIQALIRRETGRSAFITIDQEGGCVTRLPDDAVNVSGGMALAATGNPDYARRAAAITARELHALGINFNFAPDVDINNNPDNPIIGSRCFGDTPQQVSEYALAALAGYRENHMMAAAKHFPGHGDTANDSHISLPLIDKSLAQLEKMELIPFQAMVDAGCPCIMTTHILFPQIEPKKIPATMSRTIVTELLKEKMGFRGLVVSDCMEMDAIKEFYGTAEGAAAAAAAGVDLIIVSHTEALLEQAAVRLEKAVLDGDISMEEMDASVEKILHYKALYCTEPSGEAGTPEAFAESNEIRARSLVHIGSPIPELGSNPLFIGCADYRSGLVSNTEVNENTFAGFMSARFGGDAIVTEPDPGEAEIAAAVAAAAGHTALVVNTYNGHLFSGQMALVEALGRTKLPMVVVALRNPYDLKDLPAHAAGIAAWDYSTMTLEALVPVLAGTKDAPGKMPITLYPTLKG
ncbi:MAG: glycoside hydrolase family 3 [Oscillospiraceae bacterium]|nr:glycoside hydrolase family 3 [Oscillospiraceae bacterium]